MNDADDRPWKAEDLLGAVVPGNGARTAARVARYFDLLEADPPPAALPAGGAIKPAQADRAAHPHQELPTEPPVMVPNHTLIRCLGVGGFGQVWLAKHALTEHYRACKLIPANKAIELEGLRRLKQRVPGHPGLFPIEDVGVADDWLYCLMPLADAATTDQAVLEHGGYQPLTLDLHLNRHGRRSTSEAAAVGVQLAEAIRHLHAHGVTHGDIKPANIMRLNGAWTLADYGLARDLSAPAGEGHTPGYSPPEGPGSTRADQYALGVVLMELLTCWTAGMLKDFREAPIGGFNLDHEGPRLAEVIRRATQPEPDNRFGSMDEFVDALRAIVSSTQAGTGPKGVRWLWPAALVVIILLIGVGAVLLRPQGPPLTSPVKTPALAAFDVESFEVRHYRYDPDTDTSTATGASSADNPAARATDDVTVHARFSQPAYFYLLSLDTDGRVCPRMPASPTDPPVLAASIDYPCDPVADPNGNIFYNLNTGPGTQGFMLLASAEPLPAWSDWIAAHGEPTWSRESLPPGAVVLFDGREIRTLYTTRDLLPRRGRLVLDPIDWAKAQEGIALRFIAFPVLPQEEN